MTPVFPLHGSGFPLVSFRRGWRHPISDKGEAFPLPSHLKYAQEITLPISFSFPLTSFATLQFPLIQNIPKKEYSFATLQQYPQEKVALQHCHQKRFLPTIMNLAINDLD